MTVQPRGRRAVILVLVLFLTSCSTKTPDDVGADPQSTTAERGPVQLTVAVESGEVEVGEPIIVTIDVVAAEGVGIRMPTVDREIGVFAVLDSDTPPDVPVGGERRWRHQYTVDTYTPGSHEIPSFEVAFVDERPETVAADGAVEGTVASSPLTISVASVLDEVEIASDEPRDIRATVDVPGDGLAWWQWTILIVALTVAVALCLLYRLWLRGRRGPDGATPAAPVIPADVWARQALAELRAENLIESGAFELFYVRLSGIVREYIERRFGLMAPERTTEEFLREARSSSVLGPGHQTLLEGFLRSADMVKFALHVPASSDAGDAIDAAGAFVEDTAPRADAEVSV